MEKKTYNSSPTSTRIGVHGGNQGLLNRVFELLRHRGFTIQTDQRIAKQYPSLADTHWEGSKGELLFKAQIYPAGFSIEFYQEVNTKNPNGGFYDFEKFEMMPYLIRCEFLLARKYICKLIESEGYENDANPEFKNALENVMYRIKSCCHYKEGKELPDYEIPSYNAKDRDGKQLRNGQVKYFYDYKGRLMRGTVYHNINNMWWVVLNKFQFSNIGAYQFFDIVPGNFPERRIQNKKMPQRIKANNLREKFIELGFSYKKLNEEHINKLRSLLTKEFEVFESDLKLKLSTPRKKDVKILKRTGLKYAVIEVDGFYFNRREAITFSSNGFIGFAGWACDVNVTPFVNAFEKWLDWLQETIDQAA